jgi:hypothetical protein
MSNPKIHIEPDSVTFKTEVFIRPSSQRGRDM